MTLQRRDLVIWISASVAVLLGLAVQHLLGAPTSGLMVQAAGAGVGAILFFALSRVHPPGRTSVTAVGLAICLVAMALPLIVGPELAGARRWLLLGPISIQPSMILLPLVIWLVAVPRPSLDKTFLVLATGGVLALQFDAAALTGLTLAWLAGHLPSARRGEIHVRGVAFGLAALT